MHTQYWVQNERLDGYFPKHKLGIEIDECGHVDRNSEYEQSWQLMIEEKIGCKVIRINTDAPDFYINKVINLVFMYIKQSTKKSLIDDLSKRILKSISKIKVFKMDCQKIPPDYKEWLVNNMWKKTLAV